LVEDEEIVRSLARTTLESAGYRVLEAGSGEEALLIVRDDTEIGPAPDRRRHARDERARARRARDGDTSRARRPLHLGVQRGGDRPPAPARPDRGLPREAVHGVRADANGPRHARFRPSRLGVSGPDETRLFTMQRSRTLRYRGRMALTKTIS